MKQIEMSTETNLVAAAVTVLLKRLKVYDMTRAEIQYIHQTIGNENGDTEISENLKVGSHFLNMHIPRIQDYQIRNLIFELQNYMKGIEQSEKITLPHYYEPKNASQEFLNLHEIESDSDEIFVRRNYYLRKEINECIVNVLNETDIVSKIHEINQLLRDDCTSVEQKYDILFDKFGSMKFIEKTDYLDDIIFADEMRSFPFVSTIWSQAVILVLSKSLTKTNDINFSLEVRQHGFLGDKIYNAIKNPMRDDTNFLLLQFYLSNCTNDFDLDLDDLTSKDFKLKIPVNKKKMINYLVYSEFVSCLQNDLSPERFIHRYEQIADYKKCFENILNDYELRCKMGNIYFILADTIDQSEKERLIQMRLKDMPLLEINF